MPNATGTSDAAFNTLYREQFLFDCENLLQFGETLNGTLHDHNESTLEVKLKELDSEWVSLKESYRKVIVAPDELVGPEFKTQARGEYTTCSEIYYNCSSQINEMLKVSRIESPLNPALQSTSRYPPPEPNLVPNTLDSFIKLPPCDTEIFKGSYEQWPSFRDMFTAVYINHSRLSPVVKLYHLRNKTRGEAGAIVKRYTLSHENFELAWNALKIRYENKRVLVDNQIKLLFDIPAAVKEDSESIQRIQSAVNDSLATLRTLGVEVESWDPILIRLISTKLPEVTLSLWEQSLTSPRELPKWSQMSQFLVERYEAVERLSSIRKSKDCFNLSRTSQTTVQTYVAQENLNTNCKLCEGDHGLRNCSKFRSFTVQQRIDYVFQNKFCNNCLGTSHLKANCKSKYTCLVCKKQHHTLLHMNKGAQGFSQDSQKVNMLHKGNDSQNSAPNTLRRVEDDRQAERPTTSKRVQANCSTGNENILLRTALMQIEHRGETFTIRALIDPGSQRTFVTEKIRSRLQLPYRKSCFEIVGIGGKKQSATKECDLILYAKRENARIPIKAIVLPKVTKRLPTCSFEVPQSEELKELDLADPTFNKSSQIDLILGSDYERFINIEGIRKNVCGQTSAYNTVFGWVLSGPMQAQTVQTFTTSVIRSDALELNALLRKFWEEEEIPISRPKSEEEENCERFYKQTTTRCEDGKFMVRLPFRSDYPNKIHLGSSRFTALAQNARMEQTLNKNPELKLQYKAVLEEYLTLGHMEETASQEIISDGKYESFYLPHHAVVRPEHKTTKVRVVFNASRRTKSQVSLNDILYTGPTLQNDLVKVILNWRQYRYVFSGDIQKMYRQIWVHPEDRKYQKIVFQNQPDDPIKDYQLKTVTFGVNCAPYLAIRTLLQLSSECEATFPKAASILRTQTYVDDILAGVYTIEETLDAQTQLISALKSAGFPLKKITANSAELLSNLPAEDLYDSNFLRFHEASSTKTLGIKWNALSDAFTYSFTPIEKFAKLTKRQILSYVAKLFDPAGWLTPIVIRAKILMQRLWLEGLDWDEEISAESLRNWNELVVDLSKIEEISINRWIQYTPEDKVQIHGFCDASKAAYCATVYIRCQTKAHTTFSNLLLAKSRVAPIQTVCLPRLELNGAVLLANLVRYVKTELNFTDSETFLWTDSSIVLGWLSKPPSTWETYVANRISQIHRLVPDATWRHVPTHTNPADLGTRGCKSQELVNHTQWWYGPPWLHKPISDWPKRNPLKTIEQPVEVQTLLAEVQLEEEILNRFSSYTRALRVLVYVFRFFNKIAARLRPEIAPCTGEITLKELNHVKLRLLALAQRAFYHEEYHGLLDSKPISKKSSLKPLNPFLDSNFILRVNGRLTQSSLPYNERYPMILPGSSRFCHLYLTHLHEFLYHAEISQMCRMVQTEYYLSRLKPRVKKVIRHCKTCIIFKQQSCVQLMAPLPPERCTLSLPFQVTGIDFAGPFDIKSSALRTAAVMKGYVAVFVCFSTKAVHLEACSDLTSAAFRAAFARFVGRRGLPQRVVTDNGKNFLGASRELENEFNIFVKTIARDVSQRYVIHGFEWRFIPPYAPHMGGLWEAAVKSFKFHLKRVVGARKLDFEEFATILARIEGVLNSRPISALSEDPVDMTALTPGHFLRGAPLMALPEQDFQSMSVTNRWEKLKAMHHQFSLRWKEEYLRALQKRYKWKDSVPNVQVGDLVVVMDNLLPPAEWRLGRVENVYGGADENVRTADVRIATGVITRPIVKLCYLPLLNKEDASGNGH